MAYNKAGEEKKWRLWKEAEEMTLRRLGVSEDVIKTLRDADWEDFKADRQFYEHSPDTGIYLDWQAADGPTSEFQTVQDLLDDIGNEKLHKLLLSVDKLTVLVAIWKMDGFTSAEISRKSGLSVSAVNVRIWKLRKKIKNIL